MKRPVLRLPDPAPAPLAPVWVHSFDNSAVSAFADQVAAVRAARSPLVLAIHSPGGDVYGLTAMLDILAAQDQPVVTVAIGQAMSCGAILFSAGAKGCRYAAPNATFLLHDASGDAGGGTLKDQEASVNETRRVNDLAWSVLDRNTGVALSAEHRRRGGADWFLTAREAVRVGLASRVGVPFVETVTRWDPMLGEAGR